MVIFLIGGQRSGKSVQAEQMALSLSERPVYLATARVCDDEFARRVELHKVRRGSEWQTIEEPLVLSRHDVRGQVVLVDCCTLWLSNCLEAYPRLDDDALLNMVKEEFLRFTRQDATFIFVSNEIGLGGIGGHPLQRRFADLLGLLNQFVAAHADKMYFIVAGRKMEIEK